MTWHPARSGWGAQLGSGKHGAGRGALPLFVVSYLGLGVPAVAAGSLAVRGPGLIGATHYYGAGPIMLALLALLALVHAERNERKRS